MSFKKKLFLVSLASLILLIGLIEVVFRIYKPPNFKLGLLTLDHEKEARVIGHPYMSFMLKPDFRRGKFVHNSLGFRGPEIERVKPEGTFRIACIGGSSTYGHGPSSAYTTWSRLLEKKLCKNYPGRSIEVINCGTSGYSTFENLPNLAFRILDLNPDLIIIYQTVNDMHCGVKSGPYLRDNRHWRAVFHVDPKPEWSKFMENSRTFLLYRWLCTDYMTMGDLAATTIVNFGDPYMQKRWHAEEIECFRRNLRSMIAVAREFGVSVLISTQACYTKHLGLVSERKSTQVHRQVLKEVARKHKTYFIDNADPALMPQDETLYTNDVHMTDKGTQRLSDNFTRYITENQILDNRRLPVLSAGQ